MEENKRKKGSMVFPLIPIYEDPSNWNQQQPHELGTNTSNLTRSDNDPIQISPIVLAPEPVPNLFSPVPTSLTSEQVRLTQVLHPESGLKCPRCDSTNTKFCYFNNYSLSQPRHFCRTCRRYWTRGGTLRNVPVGGGSRHTKKWPRQVTSITTPAHTGKHLCINTNAHHIGMSSGNGFRLPGKQLPFRQFPFTGAFDTTHVLPSQLGVSSHLHLSSKKEELPGVCINASGTSMGSNRGGSQGSLPSVVSLSCGDVFQQHSLFN